MWALAAAQELVDAIAKRIERRVSVARHGHPGNPHLKIEMWGTRFRTASITRF